MNEYSFLFLLYKYFFKKRMKRNGFEVSMTPIQKRTSHREMGLDRYTI